MTTENKQNFDKLRSIVHQGVPMEEEKQSIPRTEEIKATEAVDAISEPVVKTAEPSKRKRKVSMDYQDVFFTRIDFTHRKPLYITANTHRRLMRIVHLMDESKATISSYVENIILNHLETFKEDIDTIYQTNNLNPTE